MVKYPVLLLLITSAIDAFSQERRVLDEAIEASFAYMGEQVPEGTSLAFGHIASPYEQAAQYIRETLSALAVEAKTWIVTEAPDPQQKTAYQRQRSGDDQSAANFGLDLGIQVVVFGSFETLDLSVFILHIRIMAVETETLLGQRRFELSLDRQISDLTGIPTPEDKEREAAEAAARAEAGREDPWTLLDKPGFSFALDPFVQFVLPTPAGAGFSVSGEVMGMTVTLGLSYNIIYTIKPRIFAPGIGIDLGATPGTWLIGIALVGASQGGGNTSGISGGLEDLIIGGDYGFRISNTFSFGGVELSPFAGYTGIISVWDKKKITKGYAMTGLSLGLKRLGLRYSFLFAGAGYDSFDNKLAVMHRVTISIHFPFEKFGKKYGI